MLVQKVTVGGEGEAVTARVDEEVEPGYPVESGYELLFTHLGVPAVVSCCGNPNPANVTPSICRKYHCIKTGIQDFTLISS